MSDETKKHCPINRRLFLSRGGLALAGGVLAASGIGCSSARGELQIPPVADVERQGGLDATVFLVADTHYGHVDDSGRDIASLNEKLVNNLNRMEGRPYPEILGGSVDDPWGVIVAGDLTEDGEPDEWDQFQSHFGLRGEKRLQYDVYECIGNHDRHAGSLVANNVIRRHGSRVYSHEIGDLKIINLGEFPDSDSIHWLQAELAETGTERPVLLYFHYGILGPYSHSDWMRKWKLLYAIQDYNIIGIFHGHYHASGMYDFFGFDVYNVGASKHGSNSFAVIRVTDDRFTVAEWNWGFEDWWWTHTKPLHGSNGKEHLEIFPSLKGWREPVIPYPRFRDSHRG